MATLKVPSVTTDSQVPAEVAAQFLRLHQVRADVTRSALSALDMSDGKSLTVDVYAGQVDTAPVRKFLGY